MNTEEILERLNQNSKECVIKNRRKGPDFLLQVVNLSGVIIWFFVLTLFAICERAELRMLDFNQKIESISQVKWTNVGIVMATIMFFVSAALLLLSLKRTRRKTDKLKISLLISEVISFFIGILLLIKIY